MPAPGDLAVWDLDTARAVIATLQEQVARSQRDNAVLRDQLDVVCRRLFGKRSEKVDPSQLRLALEQLANESGPASEPVEMDSGESLVRGHTRRASTGRRPFPPDLPREVTHIDLPEADKVCGSGGTKVRIAPRRRRSSSRRGHCERQRAAMDRARRCRDAAIHGVVQRRAGPRRWSPSARWQRCSAPATARAGDAPGIRRRCGRHGRPARDQRAVSELPTGVPSPVPHLPGSRHRDHA